MKQIRHISIISQSVIRFLKETGVFILMLIISTMLLFALAGCKSSKEMTQSIQTECHATQTDSVRKFTLDVSTTDWNRYLTDSISVDLVINADSIKLPDCIIYNPVIKKSKKKKTEITEKHIEVETITNATDSISQIQTDSISEINIKSETKTPTNDFFSTIVFYSFLFIVLFIFISIIRWLRR